MEAFGASSTTQLLQVTQNADVEALVEETVMSISDGVTFTRLKLGGHDTCNNV